MTEMNISVIIPTFNRRQTLGECLARLSCPPQAMESGSYEVLVVDDGSDDGTREAVSALAAGFPVPLRYFSQPNKGPAAARNIGIRNAAGKVLVFLGDDIIASPSLLSRHWEWHCRHPGQREALLGYITWDPRLAVTPFMRWLEDGGPQFAYGSIGDSGRLDPAAFFYSSNISLKRDFLLSRGLFFDEDFPFAAYEDLEFGSRLAKEGLALAYDREAAASHYHPTTLAQACRRMVKVGYSSQLLARKTGRAFKVVRLSSWHRVLSRVKFGIFFALGSFYERRAVNDGLYRYLMEYCQREGVKEYGDKQR